MQIVATNKEKTVNFFIVKRRSKNKHPFVVVAEDVNQVCGMDMGRFKTEDEAIKTIERMTK